MLFLEFYAVQLHLSFPFPFPWSSSLPYYIRLHAVLQQPDLGKERDSVLVIAVICQEGGREGGIICYAHAHAHAHAMYML